MGLVRGVFKAGFMLVVLLVMFAAGWLVAKTGTGEAMDPATLPAIERQFVEKMNGAALVGHFTIAVGSSRVDLQACKLEYSIVSPK